MSDRAHPSTAREESASFQVELWKVGFFFATFTGTPTAQGVLILWSHFNNHAVYAYIHNNGDFGWHASPGLPLYMYPSAKLIYLYALNLVIMRTFLENIAWSIFMNGCDYHQEYSQESPPFMLYQPATQDMLIDWYDSITNSFVLTHWGRVTHICVSKLTIIGSDNGLSPGRRQAIIWTNAGILLIGSLGTNFSEILVGIQTFSFRKCIWKYRLRYSIHFVSASMS